MTGQAIRGGVLLATGCVFAATVGTVASQQAGNGQRAAIRVLDDGRVQHDGTTYASGMEFARSDVFRTNGLRCLTDEMNAEWIVNDAEGGNPLAGGSSADCSSSFTNPDAIYDPSVVKYRIPVVVHVIRHTNGTGHLTESQVQSQIDILNEDFLALPATNGANGTDVQIESYLATEDPIGDPTNGITYTDNNSWFGDVGTYYNTLAWDTTRYLNIYTNNVSGLGYAYLPWSGTLNTTAHRVVILYSAFGRNGSFGPPYDQGRTATHEVGHYLGLYHTFEGGTCSTSCYTTGDRICDTNTESSQHFGCSPSATCGTADPIENYMDYTDDLCMEEFTPEQARRMRCALEHYYPSLYDIVDLCPTDIVVNGATDVNDLLGLLGSWGPCGGPVCPADVNDSGTVDVLDLLQVLAAWGPCP